MITDDYNNGPRVVRKDYVLWKIQNMQESASMPSSSGQSQFSIMSLVALKLKLKNYVCVQSPIAFENNLEGTFLHISTYCFCQINYKLELKNGCFCSGVVRKLYNQFKALTVRTNDYV